jgi:hypothetical protein
MNTRHPLGRRLDWPNTRLGKKKNLLPLPAKQGTQRAAGYLLIYVFIYLFSSIITELFIMVQQFQYSFLYLTNGVRGGAVG